MNRGISGNRVVDLNARWQEDCLDLKPDWVSIYIGINDTWRRYDSGDPTSTEDYKAGYRKLIERTKGALDAKLILVEPFVPPHPEDRRVWREDLDPKITAVRELAVEYGRRWCRWTDCFCGVGAPRSRLLGAGRRASVTGRTRPDREGLA